MLKVDCGYLEYSRDFEDWIEGLTPTPEYEKMFDDWRAKNVEIIHPGTGYSYEIYPKIEDWMSFLVSKRAKISIGPYGETEWDGLYEPEIFGPYSGECTIDDLCSITSFFLELGNFQDNIVIVNGEWYTAIDESHWFWSDGYILCDHCKNTWRTDDAFSWYDEGQRGKIRYKLNDCDCVDIDDIELEDWKWRELTLLCNPAIDPSAPNKVIYMLGSGTIVYDEDVTYCPICGGRLQG